MNDQDKNLRNLAADVAGRYSLDLVILFGSRATGKIHPESDWDIAIRGRHVLTIEDRLNLIGEFEKVCHPVDISDIRRADPILLACIALDGKPLFEGGNLHFDEFKLFAFNQYHDFKPWIEKMKEANLRNLEELEKS